MIQAKNQFEQQVKICKNELESARLEKADLASELHAYQNKEEHIRKEIRHEFQNELKRLRDENSSSQKSIEDLRQQLHKI